MNGISVEATGGTPSKEGLRDTIESIVIALILAFVFRAFIVEAFVIPTGSMAPTLYGAHGTVVCEDCGVEFAYGVRDLDDTRTPSPMEVKATSRAVCPNCNHPNTHLRTTDERRNAEKGDRILVLKWPFDVGGDWLGPERWDVVVFKDPSDGTTNFIKRLVGLPGEVLMITDGDVYTVPLERLSPHAHDALTRLVHRKHQLYSGEVGFLPQVPAEVFEELDSKMSIARKTKAAQEPLWFGVYDHDFPPQKPDADQPRWASRAAGASGWDPTTRRVTFEPRGQAPDYIELINKDIRAACAYNMFGGLPQPVADVRVRFVWTPRSEDAFITVRLEKLDRAFWATIGCDGRVTIVETKDREALPDESARVVAAGQMDRQAPGRSVEVSFENVDYRLSLRIAGEEVAHSSDDRAAAGYYGPDLKALRRARTNRPSTAPRLYGRNGTFEVTHLAVDRDVYYYHDPTFPALMHRWAPKTGWGSAESPILLRDAEYFMLGDNTSASKDSRLWDQAGLHLRSRGESFQLGTVPRDQLIGKAFFVYWPSGYRIEWLSFVGLHRLGPIPDVGRMRWIR